MHLILAKETYIFALLLLGLHEKLIWPLSGGLNEATIKELS